MLIYYYVHTQLQTMKNVFSQKQSFYLFLSGVFHSCSIVVMFTEPVLAKSFVLRFIILILLLNLSVLNANNPY